MVHILSGNSLYVLLYLSIMLSNLSNVLYHVYVMYVVCMMYVCSAPRDCPVYCMPVQCPVVR